MNAKKLVLGVAMLGLSLPAAAMQGVVPYVGVDGKWSKTSFSDNANNVLPRNYLQGNLFGGVQFNEWVAFELGYESTARKTKEAVVRPGDTFFGSKSLLTDDLHTKTKTTLSGFHFNLVGLLPISEQYAISLFGSVGLAHTKIRTLLQFFDVTDPSDVANRDFTARKTIPRATVGIQHMMCNNIGVRAMVAWEKTSNLGYVYSTTTSSKLYLTPKDSVSAGLGVFYSFK